MIANPALADSQAAALEDFSFVEGSSGIRRAPFRDDHKHSCYLLLRCMTFKAKLRMTRASGIDHFNESSAARISSFVGRCL